MYGMGIGTWSIRSQVDTDVGKGWGMSWTSSRAMDFPPPSSLWGVVGERRWSVHNVVSAMVPLPRSGDLRIVFDSCQCSKEDGPTRAGCPDHVTPESRVERIVEMLKQRNERCEGRVELVGAGRVAQAGEVHTLRNLVKGKVLQSDLSDWQKDTLLFVTEDY